MGFVKSGGFGAALFGQPARNAIQDAPDFLFGRKASAKGNGSLPILQRNALDTIAFEDRRTIDTCLTIQPRGTVQVVTVHFQAVFK